MSFVCCFIFFLDVHDGQGICEMPAHEVDEYQGRIQFYAEPLSRGDCQLGRYAGSKWLISSSSYERAR